MNILSVGFWYWLTQVNVDLRAVKRVWQCWLGVRKGIYNKKQSYKCALCATAIQ